MEPNSNSNFHSHSHSHSHSNTSPTLRRDHPNPPPSNAKKGSTVRPQRPALYHRKSGSAHLPVHSHKSHSQPQLISKLGPGSGPASWSSKEDDDKPEMAASFLQYCAMCEKQITVPNNAVLYCSESCRRKDSCKPLSASFTYTMSPTTTPPSSPPMSPRAIIAPMTPTRLSPRLGPSHRIPSDFHDAYSDLDPTEWKPVISQRHSSSASLASTEAWNYLSQFHGEDALTMPSRRAGYAHRSTVSLSALMQGPGGVPPLTHTPSTAASSLNSSSDYFNYLYELGANRPLPPRHNPSYSTSAAATKGVELVVPHIVPPATTAVDVVAVTHVSDGRSNSPENEGLWLKSRAVQKTVVVEPSSVTSTLVDVNTSH